MTEGRLLTGNDFYEYRDKVLRAAGFPNVKTRFEPLQRSLVQQGQRLAISRGGRSDQFDKSVFTSWQGIAIGAGGMLDTTDLLLKAVSSEIEASRATIEETANSIRKITDVIHPALVEKVVELRNLRMGVASEVKTSLSLLRDIQECLDGYDKAVDQMDRIVKLCREFKDLKDSGVIDAVADWAIRLAIKESQ